MSEATSVLNKAHFAGLVDVTEMGVQGMITLRGDLGAPDLIKALKAATGCDVPGQRLIVQGQGGAVGWMSPDEVMILCPYARAAEMQARLQADLAQTHALAVNVSDARAVFTLHGDAVREVLAKLAPVDMAPDAFAVGALRRTRMAQVAAAFWMTDAHSAHVVCFRSVAQYVFDLLSTAADPDARVGYF